MNDSDGVRTIDQGTPPSRFARGWHCLGLADRFRDSGPHAVEAFGTKLAVFADSAGELHVLDAYCRHMGGDLSRGTIKGDALACPTYFKNVFEGHIASQYLRTRSRPDVENSNYAQGTETTLRSEASYYGPSYMIDELWHDYHGSTIQSILINCHYPVTPTSFMLQWGVIVKLPAGLPEAQADRVAAK